MKIVSYDSKLMKFLNTFYDVAFLNLLWIVGCIPIVTIGTSTIAAYTVTLKIVKGTEGYIARDFFKAYKNNLKHGTILTIILAIPLYSAWISFQLFQNLNDNPFIFLLTAILLCFVFIWHAVYIFPIEARYENKLINNLINARRVFMRFPLQSILICVLCAAEGFVFFYWCFVYDNTFSHVLMWIGILIGPMCIMMTISGMVLPLFKKIDDNDESDLEDTNISIN